jgi:hypothetical protein
MVAVSSCIAVMKGVQPRSVHGHSARVFAVRRLLVAADAAAEYVSAIPLWFDIAASVAALIGALGFTAWYPRRVRARAGAARIE